MASTRWTRGQRELLSAFRITDNRDIASAVEKASVDDLEWFLDAIELQLEETPNWITDPDVLKQTLAWYRRVRSMTTSVLHGKRVKRGRFVWWRDHAATFFWILVAAGIGYYAGTLYD
ncbi:MAG: hypothetical protein O7D27_08705 [Alphaproteobacteria bacterium]|nr:hypothetical protein [Alphaproteobacteria bacterium]